MNRSARAEVIIMLLGGVIINPYSGGLWRFGLAFVASYVMLASPGAVLGSGLMQLRSHWKP